MLDTDASLHDVLHAASTRSGANACCQKKSYAVRRSLCSCPQLRWRRVSRRTASPLLCTGPMSSGVSACKGERTLSMICKQSM